MLKLPGSDFWIARNGPHPNTITVARKVGSGAKAHQAHDSPEWEACGFCFVESNGLKAPAIMDGYCSCCGRRHYEETEPEKPARKAQVKV